MGLASLLHLDRSKKDIAPEASVETEPPDYDEDLKDRIIRNATDSLGYGSLRNGLGKIFLHDLDALGGTPTFDTYLGFQIYLGWRENKSGNFGNLFQIGELYELAIRAKACGAIEGLDSWPKVEAALEQQRMYKNDPRSPLRLLERVVDK